MDKQQKDKILILSSSTFGDGHKQVANAIEEALKAEFSNIEPIIFDIMQLAHPLVGNLSDFFYKLSIKKLPSLYGFLFKKTRTKNYFSEKTQIPLLLGIDSLLNKIHSIEPAIIVCTHPFAAAMVSKLKELHYIDIPIIVIITDYTNHSYWIYPYTDAYIVPSNPIRIKLIENGIENNKIYSTGIPIRKKFFESYSREDLALKYGLDSTTFTLLIMGGGDGFIGKELSSITSYCDNMQIIIVCGRNKKLEKNLKKKLESVHQKAIVKGYCENIEELMAISDLIISKPGGVTTSEAIAMNLPLFIYKPLPGQEEDNKNYLVHAELAFFAQNREELLKQVFDISENKEILLDMKQKYQGIPTKSSTLEALNIIFLKIKHSRIIPLIIISTTLRMVL